MALMRIRLTGNQEAVHGIMNLLQSVEDIEHVEEVDDLMAHMDDEDSSSAGLHDTRGADTHEIEIETPDPATAGKVRDAVEALAFDLDAVVEFEHDEG